MRPYKVWSQIEEAPQQFRMPHQNFGIIDISEDFVGTLKERRKILGNFKLEKGEQILISIGNGGKFYLDFIFSSIIIS